MAHYLFSDKHMPYMCYYCMKVASSVYELADHQISYHINDKFTIKVKTLDDRTGNVVYRTQHYSVSLEDTRKYELDGYKFVVDTDAVEMRFKRTIEDECTHSEPATTNVNDPQSMTPEEQSNQQHMMELLETVLKLLKDTDRDSHFISVLEAIAAPPKNSV